ncbi:MAG TPA: hypothetical protein VFS18_05800, partial [Actinomycetota bacterium]|nr:hypothetical protein [Actinomycetota bacterium]
GTLDAVVVQMPALEDSVAMGEPWPFEDVELIEADVAEPAGAHDPERLAKVLGAIDPPSDRPR